MTEIKAAPHPGQREVHSHPARYKVLDSGRRWGKTRLGVMECLAVAADGKRAWWVAPSYKMSEVGWRPLRRLAGKVGAEVRKVDRQVILPNGGSVSVRSADKPDSLRGEGLDFVVMDECAFMSELTWTEALRPALADRQGKALFISTPKGRNWFWRLWQFGQTGDEPDWKSWRFTSYDNPHVADSEIDAAKRTLPERVFRQEFMAEFIDDAGGVFRRVMDAATAKETPPEEGAEYVFGVDWAKSVDFTVITVLNARTREMVYMDRFNQIDYTVQTGRLRALVDRYSPRAVVAETNSIGEPLLEQLHRDGLPMIGFTTTNATKAQAIEALALAFERGDIAILNDPVLVNELQSYEMNRTPSGMVKYSAPEGLHDDCVMSLALAWSGIGRPMGRSLADFVEF